MIFIFIYIQLVMHIRTSQVWKSGHYKSAQQSVMTSQTGCVVHTAGCITAQSPVVPADTRHYYPRQELLAVGLVAVTQGPLLPQRQ